MATKSKRPKKPRKTRAPEFVCLAAWICSYMYFDHSLVYCSQCNTNTTKKFSQFSTRFIQILLRVSNGPNTLMLDTDGGKNPTIAHRAREPLASPDSCKKQGTCLGYNTALTFTSVMHPYEEDMDLDQDGHDDPQQDRHKKRKTKTAKKQTAATN